MTWWQDDLRDTADALTEPSIHREPVFEWVKRNRRKVRDHKTVQPGLLAQLYRSVIPSNSLSDDAGGGGKPRSRPPLAVEALSAHTQISVDVRRWCTSLGLPPRDTVESDIRQLAGKAMSFDEGTARALLAELHRWRRWCLVLTGWEQVRVIRDVVCPRDGCGQAGTLRVNLTTVSAMCRHCGGVWGEDDGGIGVLIRHVEQAQRQAVA